MNGVRIFRGVNIQVISWTSSIVMIVGFEIKRRRKCDRADNLLHTQK